jgi:hypothetical protein
LKQLKIWDVVNEQIDRSRINRFQWKKIIGETLSHYIIKKKIEGLKPLEVYNELINMPKIQEFINNNPNLKNKIFENIKISVSARYGENNSSLKIYKEKKR